MAVNDLCKELLWILNLKIILYIWQGPVCPLMMINAYSSYDLHYLYYCVVGHCTVFNSCCFVIIISQWLAFLLKFKSWHH